MRERDGADRRLRLEELDEPLVSVVVCAHNNAGCIRQCLEGLAQSDYRRLQTIVFDDASDDDTLRIAEAGLARVPGASLLLRSEKNQGFVRACNEASLRARGQVLLLLNSDAIVYPGAIGALARALRDDTRIGAAGCMIHEPDGRTIQSVGNRLAPNALGKAIGHGEEDRGQHDQAADCDYATGAALAIRTDLWFAMGGFDEDFAPAYYEDVDLCLRLRARGYRVRTIPAAKVVHLSGQSYGAGTWRFIELSLKNRIRLLVKHWTRPRFFFGALPYEVWWLASWRSKRYRRASIRGYWTGLRQMGLGLVRSIGLARPIPLAVRRARLLRAGETEKGPSPFFPNRPSPSG